MSIFNLYKQKGETPLECIERFRRGRPEFADRLKKDLPMSYAGRLDPLASGVLLALAGEEANHADMRARYLNLDKVYTVDVLFGIETDTHDLLGFPKIDPVKAVKGAVLNFHVIINESIIKRHLAKFIGKSIQPYPVFSSKTVGGKPLFEWAKAGKLDEIEIPSREIEIYRIDLLRVSRINADDLLKEALGAVESVRGDFRQKEIKIRWKELLGKPSPQKVSAHGDRQFPLVSLRISCSSGTYVRSVAHLLGQAIGAGAIAMNIVRERVGDFELADSIR